MRAKGRALGYLLFHGLGKLVKLEIGMFRGFFGHFQPLDNAAAGIGPETPGIALGVFQRRREEGIKLFLRGLGVEGQNNALIAVEAIGAFDQLQRVEAGRTIGHLAKVHRAVIGHEVLWMDEAKVDLEGLDQLVDLLLDLGAPGFKLGRGGHEDRIAQCHVFRDVQELDLAILDPCLDREFPTVQMAFQQRGKLVIRNGIDILDRADGAVPKAAGLVERLEVDRVVHVAVQLEQRLVHTLQKPNYIGVVVGLFKDADADAGQLRAALHQRLVAKQHRLAQQARVVQQHRIDRPGPFHRLFIQRDRHVAALVLEDLRNLVRTFVQPVEIPSDKGDIVRLGVFLGPGGRNDHVAPVESVDGVDRVQRPAKDRYVTLVGVFLCHGKPLGNLDQGDAINHHPGWAGMPVQTGASRLHWGKGVMSYTSYLAYLSIIANSAHG